MLVSGEKRWGTSSFFLTRSYTKTMFPFALNTDIIKKNPKLHQNHFLSLCVILLNHINLKRTQAGASSSASDKLSSGFQHSQNQAELTSLHLL